jgi:hypothetical protein
MGLADRPLLSFQGQRICEGLAEALGSDFDFFQGMLIECGLQNVVVVLCGKKIGVTKSDGGCRCLSLYRLTPEGACNNDIWAVN